MIMTVGAKFEKIEDMQLTLILSGTVAEFQTLRNNVSKTYLSPMSKFSEAIEDAIDNAKKNVEQQVIK